MHHFLPIDEATAAALRPNPEHTTAIKRWTRDLLHLPEETVITVTESACADPGCPLLETSITIFDTDGSTRRWRFTRPRAAVTKIMLHHVLAARPI